MQDAAALAFSKAGHVTDRHPDPVTTQPVSPVQQTRCRGDGQGMVAVGEVGEGVGSGEGASGRRPEEIIESREEEVQPVKALPAPTRRLKKRSMSMPSTISPIAAGVCTA